MIKADAPTLTPADLRGLEVLLSQPGEPGVVAVMDENGAPHIYPGIDPPLPGRYELRYRELRSVHWMFDARLPTLEV